MLSFAVGLNISFSYFREIRHYFSVSAEHSASSEKQALFTCYSAPPSPAGALGVVPAGRQLRPRRLPSPPAGGAPGPKQPSALAPWPAAGSSAACGPPPGAAVCLLPDASTGPQQNRRTVLTGAGVIYDWKGVSLKVLQFIQLYVFCFE